MRTYLTSTQIAVSNTFKKNSSSINEDGCKVNHDKLVDFFIENKLATDEMSGENYFSICEFDIQASHLLRKHEPIYMKRGDELFRTLDSPILMPNYKKSIKTYILELLKAHGYLVTETSTLNSFKGLSEPKSVDLRFEGDGYKITRDRLITLLREEDENECKPTPHAFCTTWDLIMDATLHLQQSFPKASVAADDEGGIRLRWRNLDKTREASLYCPSSNKEKPYIYHEVGNDYDADYKVSGLALAKWLSWLTQND